MSGSKHNRRCIDGKTTGSGKCVGYCQFYEHPGFLTERLCREHDCIQKGCYYYLPKSRFSNNRMKQSSYDSQTVLDKANGVLAEYEGMTVIRASQTASDTWKLYYVSISNIYPVKQIEELISLSMGFPVELYRLNYDFDVCAQLILRQ